MTEPSGPEKLKRWMGRRADVLMSSAGLPFAGWGVYEILNGDIREGLRWLGYGAEWGAAGMLIRYQSKRRRPAYFRGDNPTVADQGFVDISWDDAPVVLGVYSERPSRNYGEILTIDEAKRQFKFKRLPDEVRFETIPPARRVILR